MPQPDGIPATVEVVEPTGPDTQLLVRLAGQSLVVLIRARTDLKADARITLGISPMDVHLFDGNDHRRIL